jgi:hypothetical protein
VKYIKYAPTMSIESAKPIIKPTIHPSNLI